MELSIHPDIIFQSPISEQVQSIEPTPKIYNLLALTQIILKMDLICSNYNVLDVNIINYR